MLTKETWWRWRGFRGKNGWRWEVEWDRDDKKVSNNGREKKRNAGSRWQLKSTPFPILSSLTNPLSTSSSLPIFPSSSSSLPLLSPLIIPLSNSYPQSSFPILLLLTLFSLLSPLSIPRTLFPSSSLLPLLFPLSIPLSTSCSPSIFFLSPLQQVRRRWRKRWKGKTKWEKRCWREKRGEI